MAYLKRLETFQGADRRQMRGDGTQYLRVVTKTKGIAKQAQHHYIRQTGRSSGRIRIRNIYLQSPRTVEKRRRDFHHGRRMIYEQFIPKADKLYLTRIKKSFEADTYFPMVNFDEWELTDILVIDDDPQVDFSYQFETWERKN